ncbi:MAG TPA: GNAT family N-acetyltransferase [Capsulimonadaceae bacterium]|jgi:ribosomal protein S18 acetylase RimI-like enzyme
MQNINPNQPAIAIQPMSIDDYDDVMALWLGTPELTVRTAFDTRERIDAYIARNPGLSQVAWDDSRLVGAVLCGHDGRRGSLYHMCVAVDCRGRGVGRLLVERCVAGLKEQGIDSAFLFVHDQNPSAADFWQKLGCEPATEIGYWSLSF